MALYLALRGLSVLVPLVPRPLGHGLARALGWLGYLLAGAARENVAANLRTVLGEQVEGEELAREVRGVFRTAALNYYDLFRIPRLDLKSFDKLVSVSGWQHIDRALQGGKGVVVAAAHLGNLDVVANLAVYHGVDCTVPTERLASLRILRLVTKLRSSRGVHIVPLEGRSALRELFEALRANGVVAIVGDRDLEGTGIQVPFFGHTASIPSGAVSLALRTGAPLLAARPLRVDHGKFDVFVSPPLPLPASGGKDSVRAGTALLASALEGFIREAPGQWVVFERFWSDGESAKLTRSLALAGRS